MTSDLYAIPKAELHVHLEGTVTPAEVQKLAKKHKMQLPAQVMCDSGDSFRWQDFSEFHLIYDTIASVLQTAEDFYEITYQYLASLAQDNTVYSELIISPYCAFENGIPYKEMLSGIVAAVKKAHLDFAIETRLLAAIYRHNGLDFAEKMMKDVLQHPHEYMVGANIAGDTKQYSLSTYKDLCAKLRAEGLQLSVHAAEDTPAEEGIEALDVLGAKRIGHGVRMVENEEILQRIIDQKVMLEICPSSNIAIDFYPSHDAHPLHEFKKRGVNLCLNSDDPAFFAASLADEYNLAHRVYGFSTADLLAVTRNAINAGFIDDATKQKLLIRMDAAIIS